METIDWRLVIRAIEVVAERPRRIEQPDAQPLAATVRLEDQRGVAEMLPGRLDQQSLAGDQHGIRRADAGGFEGGVLARLADLEVERAAAVDGAAPVPFEPGQDRCCQFRAKAMVAGVRGGAHPVVEDPFGRRPRQVEDAAVQEPVAPWQPLPIERLGQRFEPSGVLVNYVNVGHCCLIATTLNPRAARVKY